MRNNIQTIPGRFGSKPSLFRIVRVGDDNKIPESYRGLREEKDGDGDGLVNDGKPSERPADKKEPKKKSKSAIKAEAGIKIFKDFEKYRGPGGSQKERLDFLSGLNDDDRSALIQHMKKTVGFDVLDRNDFLIAKKRHARLQGDVQQKPTPTISKSQDVPQAVKQDKPTKRPTGEIDSLKKKKTEWFDYLQSVGTDGPQDLEEFSKSKGTKYDALHAFTHGAFFDMNLDAEHPASKAMSGLVKGISPTEHEGPMYRVLGFADDESRNKFIASLDQPQEKTFASWTYEGDPASPKATPMNNIGLDLASQFGDKLVVLRHADAFASKAKDISFAYQSPGAEKLSTGTELITGKGHRLGVLGQKLDGDKLIVDVYTKKPGNHVGKVTEAFCATGEKGGVKNDCPPKRQPKLPSKPTFVSSDAGRNAENDAFVRGMIDMFNAADVAGLRAVEHPSPKVQAYAKALRAALAVAGVEGDNPIDLFGSTEVMHTENGKYTEKRRKLHAAIYEQLLAGAQPVEKPTFVLLGGGSASGKSSLVAGTVPAIPDSIVRVDADQIKSMLPEYAALSGKDSRAAAFAHNESAFMAKELASLAASRGYNTMLDGTGNGSEGGLAKKVGIAKKQGMKVVAVYATTDLQTAIARNRERAKTEGRMVPQSFLEYSHQQVSALFPKFVRNGSFDEAHLYDTTGKEPKKIATLSDGEFVVHNQAAYDSFLRKAGG